MSANNLQHLQGKVALVTGATRGIGLAIARELASFGASVVVNAGTTSDEKLLEVVSSLPGGSGRHLSCRADVAQQAEVNAMAGLVSEHYGRCDILVNNAGFTKFVPHNDLNALTDEIVDKTIGVNLKGPLNCVRAFADLLRKNPPGLVVNITSVAHRSALGSSVVYCATKSGLINMTQSLARALAPEIRVNAVSPGLTDTEFTKGWKEYRAEQIKRTPLGRLGTPEDVAKCVRALAIDMTFVTGEEILVDGGRILG